MNERTYLSILRDRTEVLTILDGADIAYRQKQSVQTRKQRQPVKY